MWLIADYEAASLFSLKLSTATSSGGKSLLAPTPYALKMALVDVACRLWGVAETERRWPIIRGLRVALRPAPQVVVSNLFQKILRARKHPPKPDDLDFGPFQKTIGYREYVQWQGPLRVAVDWTAMVAALPVENAKPKGRKKKAEAEAPSEPEKLSEPLPDPASWLPELFLNVNYLGKRGGFVQLLAPPQLIPELPTGFIEITRSLEAVGAFSLNGVLQVLDDCGPALTFTRANIYSEDKLKPGDRVLQQVVLPYRLVRSSKSFSWYERSD